MHSKEIRTIRFRAVLFDLDDTLCDDLFASEQCIRQAAAIAATRIPNLDADVLTDAYVRLGDIHWTAIDLINPPSLAEVRRFLWESALAEAVGHRDLDVALVDDITRLYSDLRRTGLHLFPDALATLDRLREHGVKLGIVTNGVSETHAEKIVALGIRDHFDTLIMPDQVGFAKPDARVFHLACANLGVAPEDAAMVGDNPMADVAGAIGAGLFGVWLNPNGRPFPSTTLKPDLIVSSLTEAADRLLAMPSADAAR